MEGKRKEKKRGILLEEVILESSAGFLRLLADIRKSSTCPEKPATYKRMHFDFFQALIF